jgi:hypothetical protein
MSVTLLEVLAAARARRACLVGETVAYLVLALADQVVNAPRRVSPGVVSLTEDGTIRMGSSPACSPTQAEADLRALLAQLLVDARVGVPALVRASQREHPGNVAGLSSALEAALVPINRGAIRRALARVYRETEHAIRQGEPEFPQPEAPETPPTLDRRPSPPAPGQGVEFGCTAIEPGARAPSVSDRESACAPTEAPHPSAGELPVTRLTSSASGAVWQEPEWNRPRSGAFQGGPRPERSEGAAEGGSAPGRRVRRAREHRKRGETQPASEIGGHPGRKASKRRAHLDHKNARAEGSGLTAPLPPVQERTEPWTLPRPVALAGAPAKGELSPPEGTAPLTPNAPSAPGISAAHAELSVEAEAAGPDAVHRPAQDRGSALVPEADAEHSVELAEYMVVTPSVPEVSFSAIPLEPSEAFPSLDFAPPTDNTATGIGVHCDPWPLGTGCVERCLESSASEPPQQPGELDDDYETGRTLLAEGACSPTDGATWELEFEWMAGMRPPGPSSPPPDVTRLWCAPPVFESKKSDIEELVSCFSVSASASDCDLRRFLTELAGMDRTPAPPALRGGPAVAIGATPAKPGGGTAGQTT